MSPANAQRAISDRLSHRHVCRRCRQVGVGWTRGHSERVTAMAMLIARRMALSETRIELLNRGAQLHDIGKLEVPSSVLDKPGQLTREELELMQDHPLIGERMLESIPGFEKVVPMVGQHHEFYNGQGYPRGLRGDQIDLCARILAVADTWDALCSHRPYREALPVRQVVTYIVERSGVQFDPRVVEAFAGVMSELP